MIRAHVIEMEGNCDGLRFGQVIFDDRGINAAFRYDRLSGRVTLIESEVRVIGLTPAHERAAAAAVHAILPPIIGEAA